MIHSTMPRINGILSNIVCIAWNEKVPCFYKKKKKKKKNKKKKHKKKKQNFNKIV